MTPSVKKLTVTRLVRNSQKEQDSRGLPPHTLMHFTFEDVSGGVASRLADDRKHEIESAKGMS